MKSYREMVDLFERANTAFLEHDKALFSNQVSERTLCGALRWREGLAPSVE